MKEGGDMEALQQEKKVPVQIWITLEQLKAIKHLAVDEGISHAQWCRSVVLRELERRK